MREWECCEGVGWCVSVCVFRQRGVGRLHHSRSNSRQSLVAMTTAERKPPSIYPIRALARLGRKDRRTEKERYKKTPQQSEGERGVILIHKILCYDSLWGTSDCKIPSGRGNCLLMITLLFLHSVLYI